MIKETKKMFMLMCKKTVYNILKLERENVFLNKTF